MSVSLSTVLNDVAEKFMKNNQKIEQSDVKKDVKKEIMANNAIIGRELESIKEQIAQIGGQVAQQQQMGYPVPMMMPQPTMMMPQPTMMAQPAMMAQQQNEQPVNTKKTKNNKAQNNQGGNAGNNQGGNNAGNNQGGNNANNQGGNNAGEKEKTIAQTQMDEIDEELQKREIAKVEKEQDNSMFNTAGGVLGSIGTAAASVLGTGNETPADMGPAAGKPLELPSLNNVENQVGEGLDQAANTMKKFTGLNKEANNDSTILGRMTSSMVEGVKKIGKNAIGTAETAANITNNALNINKHRKCNKEFLEDLPSIIDTCDRDNYVVIFNTILEKLKGRQNNFRDVIKKQIDSMELIDLEKEAEIEPEEDTLTIDVNNLNNDPSEENTSTNLVAENKKPPSKKSTVKKLPSKKPAVKKPSAKKPAVKKPTAQKPIKKSSTLKKPLPKKPIKKSSTLKKPLPKKPVGKKSQTKKLSSEQLATKILGKPLTRI